MMTLDLPSTRDEAWRWSDLSALGTLASAVPSGVAATTAETLFVHKSDNGWRLVFVDGVLDAALSNPGPLVVGKASGDAGGHPLAALTADGLGWSVRLESAASATNGPIEIVHLSTGGAHHLTGQIVLEAGVETAIVETYAGAGWANRLTNVTLAKGARLSRAVRLLGDGGFTSLMEKTEVGEEAFSNLVILGAGSGDTRIDVDTRLTAADGRADIGAALLARGTQRHDANVVVHHASTGGKTNQLWRLVAQDRAVCSIAGRVEVARHAQKTDAVQSLKGLLVERTATVNLKPELEIYADDVKCAHGATVGELSRDALFYLAARGVSPQDARALLTRAFIADAFSEIADEAVREVFQAGADDWLGGAE